MAFVEGINQQDKDICICCNNHYWFVRQWHMSDYSGVRFVVVTGFQ